MVERHFVFKAFLTINKQSLAPLPNITHLSLCRGSSLSFSAPPSLSMSSLTKSSAEPVEVCLLPGRAEQRWHHPAPQLEQPCKDDNDKESF